VGAVVQQLTRGTSAHHGTTHTQTSHVLGQLNLLSSVGAVVQQLTRGPSAINSKTILSTHCDVSTWVTYFTFASDAV